LDFGGADDGQEEFDECGFAGAVRPEQAEDLTGVNLEVNTFEGVDGLLAESARIGLCDMCDIDRCG